MARRDTDLRPVGWTMATAALLRWLGNKIVTWILVLFVLFFLFALIATVDNEAVRTALAVVAVVAVIGLRLLYDKGRASVR